MIDIPLIDGYPNNILSYYMKGYIVKRIKFINSNPHVLCCKIMQSECFPCVAQVSKILNSHEKILPMENKV